MVEPLPWEFISGLLKDPELLRPGLEEMIERERDRLRGVHPGDEGVVVFVLPERTTQMGG
jgi:hypothetical protein